MNPAVGAKVGRFTLTRPIETDDERTVWLGSHDAQAATAGEPE
jgi:hypothetical protein